MKQTGEGLLLRIFVGESDKVEGKPLYQAIVEKAKQDGMAGATVLKGFMGFGANSCIHYAGILRLSEDLPVVIEIVDEENKINRFLQEIESWISEGLVTLEKVNIIAYRHRP